MWYCGLQNYINYKGNQIVLNNLKKKILNDAFLYTPTICVITINLFMFFIDKKTRSTYSRKKILII